MLDESPRMAGARAGEPTTLLAIKKTTFDELLDQSSSFAKAMFDIVVARMRSTEGLLRQSERMAQLGTLTAGVAHELNNPAAAVKRGAHSSQILSHRMQPPSESALDWVFRRSRKTYWSHYWLKLVKPR